MTAILIKFKWNYIRNNKQSVVFLLSFILFNAILFIWRLYEWQDFGWLIMLARANGQCLNFTCAFILVCVFRKSITKLRSKGFSEYLPLDHHVYYHKLTGWTIVFYSLFHTAMHVINFKVVSKVTTIPWEDLLFSTYLGIGWIGGAACLTGWILLVLLIAMIVSAQPFMRRSGMFEVFYYTHLLYVPFYVCLFIHAPNFWIWALLPFVVFTIEWTLRVTKSRFGDRGLTFAEKGIILPSRVIQLIVRRPLNFDFHPGDYVYVQIPAITKYEWHPLTISSAPEQEDFLWLHIRAVGEWTNRLYNYFYVETTIPSVPVVRVHRSNIQSRRRLQVEAIDKRLIEVRLDGPYGSPSSHLFHTQHAVLIATGIGVTPFASILQSIMLRYIEAKRSCPSCSHSWSDPIPPRVMKLRKVDFMWINRDQTSFEWFVNLLSDLERQQEMLREKDRFLDIHMHITGNDSAFPQPNLRERQSSIPLEIRGRSDSNTGLMMQKGRPDWQKFFQSMAEKNRGRITVFFCGRDDLARSLRIICSRFGFQFRKEVF